jgi:hypothetical protein
MHRNPVGFSESWSAFFLLWTVLIGQTGFVTTTSIPNPTLSVKRHLKDYCQ